MAKAKKRTIWNVFDSLEGDKVVWIIVLFLILMSIVCLFSSTSRLLTGDMTRLDVVQSQLKIVGLGILFILGIYKIKRLDILKKMAMCGLPLSLLLLLLLVSQIDTQIVRSIEINHARRILSVCGFQVHVFEVVKVAMVMYIAWAQDAISRGKIKKPANKKTQRIVYIYAPYLAIIALVITGSISAAVFLGGILFITILFGGEDLKELFLVALAAVAMLAIIFGIYKMSGEKVFQRIGTGISRFVGDEDFEAQVLKARPGSKDYYDALDEIRQPFGAKIAIKEGKVTGKGPGQSTQRYVVPDMSEDYMFSFIVEEYGWLGTIVIILLYVSLLARGTLITKNCGSDKFAKIATAGLCLLISGQAFLHMFVNADIGPMTGQTLPLVSHGNSAFLCFCIAFGFILSISRIAAKGIERIEDKADSLNVPSQDKLYEELNEEAQQYDNL